MCPGVSRGYLCVFQYAPADEIIEIIYDQYQNKQFCGASLLHLFSPITILYFILGKLLHITIVCVLCYSDMISASGTPL